MAGSRMEKLSTIFKRYTGLINAGAVLEESRPLWYDVYKAFPPSTEPTAVREISQEPIKNIFYAEDAIRSRLHKNFAESSYVYNFIDQTIPNASESFIDKYLRIAKKDGHDINLNDEQLLLRTADSLREKGIQLIKKKVEQPKMNFIQEKFSKD